MMMTAHLYFSICSCKNVEGNELAQQKLKPKLISCWSKRSIVSLSMGTSAANPEKKKNNQPALKNRNRWQRKHQSPFVVFPSSLWAPLHACARRAQSWAASRRQLCFAARGAGCGVPQPAVPQHGFTITGEAARSCQSSL